MAKSTSQSPIKRRPLRNPGQSVEQQIERIFEDTVVPWILAVSMMAGLTVFTAIFWFTNTRPHPGVPLALFVVTAVLAFFRIRHSIHRMKPLKLARDGERAVAEYLDTLKTKNCRVLHDLVGEGFNLDHVVISAQGIYTIETKTISKPTEREARVIYDGETVTVGGFTPDRDPIRQAKAQASWLRTLLADMTGKTFSVRPVVVYPGWYTERTNKERGKEVWVLEPKALGGFIEREPPQLSSSDVALVSNALKMYARNREQ
jgi:hypothetical protein